MQKKPDVISKQLDPVKLHVRDVEHLVNLLKEDCKKVFLETKNYILNSSDDLYNLNKEFISQLEIKSYEPHISLEFSEYNLKLYASVPNNSAFGMTTKIQEFLKIKRKKLFFLYRVHYALLTAIVLSAIITFTLEFFKIYSNQDYYFDYVSGLVIFIVMMGIYYFRFNRYCVISLKKEQKSNLFKDYPAITGTISTVIGGLILYYLFNIK